MTYTIVQELPADKSEGQESHVTLVKTSTKHNAIDFDKEGFVQVEHFRIESGFIELSPEIRIEITRVLQSCPEGHNHGVYYQSPRQLTVWEAMFAVGETPDELPTDLTANPDSKD